MKTFLANYAEFQAPVSTGGVFYAAWPRNAPARDLRALSGMLAQTLEWWADKADRVKAGNAEYDSWLVAASGVALPDGSRDANDPTRGWRPMKTAPKDGTIVRLLVDYSGDDACNPLEDEQITHTIGGCTDDHTGLSEGWKFAGWSWEQDCFCEGRGKAIGWLPFAPTAGVSVLDDQTFPPAGTDGSGEALP